MQDLSVMGSRTRIEEPPPRGLVDQEQNPMPANLRKWRRGTVHMASVHTASTSARMKQDVNGRPVGPPVVLEARASEIARLPTWQQGDMSMYTSEQVRARAALRYDRLVLSQLQSFWETAQRFRGGDALSSTLDFDGCTSPHVLIHTKCVCF